MKEMIHLVDEQDNVVGSKERAQIDQALDIYRVSALWLTNTKGEVLLAQRSMQKQNDPGVWGPAVAGTVNSSETYDQSITKEMAEELGLTDIHLETGPKQRVTFPRNYFVQWYTAVVTISASDFRIQKEEVEQVMWFNMTDIREKLAVHPDNFTPGFGEALTLLDA